ncbi:hypothetical protein JZ751_018759, partial [Albula glossodonta]
MRMQGREGCRAGSPHRPPLPIALRQALKVPSTVLSPRPGWLPSPRSGNCVPAGGPWQRSLSLHPGTVGSEGRLLIRPFPQRTERQGRHRPIQETHRKKCTECGATKRPCAGVAGALGLSGQVLKSTAALGWLRPSPFAASTCQRNTHPVYAPSEAGPQGALHSSASQDTPAPAKRGGAGGAGAQPACSTFHCKDREFLVRRVSQGGEGASGAAFSVVKLVTSEGDPWTARSRRAVGCEEGVRPHFSGGGMVAARKERQNEVQHCTPVVGPRGGSAGGCGALAVAVVEGGSSGGRWQRGAVTDAHAAGHTRTQLSVLHPSAQLVLHLSRTL